MPTPTYSAISKTVLTSNQATITFSGIPSTYTDLVLLISARHTGAYNGGSLQVRLNGSTSSYSLTRLYGNSTGTASNTQTSLNAAGFYGGGADGSSDTANSFSSAEIYLTNYASSSIYKSMLASGVSETNSNAGNSAYIEANAFLWANTASTTQIDLFVSGASLVSGSRFDLYGIKNS